MSVDCPFCAIVVGVTPASVVSEDVTESLRRSTAAAVLRPAGYEQLRSFVTPGLALVKMIGRWVAVLFLFGAATAAFNSIMPVMWAVGFMFMNGRGKQVQDTDRSFRAFYGWDCPRDARPGNQ